MLFILVRSSVSCGNCGLCVCGFGALPIPFAPRIGALQVALLLLSSSCAAHDKKHSSLRSQTKWGEATTTHTTHTTTLFVNTLCLPCHASKETKKEAVLPFPLAVLQHWHRACGKRVALEKRGRASSNTTHAPPASPFALRRLSKAWTFGLFLTGCLECVHGGLTH